MNKHIFVAWGSVLSKKHCYYKELPFFKLRGARLAFLLFNTHNNEVMNTSYHCTLCCKNYLKYIYTHFINKKSYPSMKDVFKQRGSKTATKCAHGFGPEEFA